MADWSRGNWGNKLIELNGFSGLNDLSKLIGFIELNELSKMIELIRLFNRRKN